MSLAVKLQKETGLMCSLLIFPVESVLLIVRIRRQTIFVQLAKVYVRLMRKYLFRKEWERFQFTQSLVVFMMGPYGCLVTKAIHEKHTHKEYIGVDACAVNLMRPAMYGAYHHITVMGKEKLPCDHIYDITGSLARIMINLLLTDTFLKLIKEIFL